MFGGGRGERERSESKALYKQLNNILMIKREEMIIVSYEQISRRQPTDDVTLGGIIMDGVSL